MQITDKFEIVPVAEIKPDAHNARKHSDEQIKELRRSLREFGFVNPLLIDKDKKIIAGHGRLTAAIAEGIEKVPCIFVEHLTEAQRRAYMLADNRLAEHATWDITLLNEELKFLDDLGFDVSLTGFDMPDDKEAVDDGYEPELPTTPKSKVGQVYRLGRHRLMCGDSTNAEHVALLMDGAQADLLLTDPPYNVDYKGKTKDELTMGDRVRCVSNRFGMQFTAIINGVKRTIQAQNETVSIVLGEPEITVIGEMKLAWQR